MKISEYRHRETGAIAEAILVATGDEIRQVRAMTDWHDGQVRILTYPTHAPILFVGLGNDVALLGRQHLLGQYLIKGPAGDIEPIPAALLEQDYELVLAAGAGT